MWRQCWLLSLTQKGSHTMNMFHLARLSMLHFIWVSWNNLWSISVAWGRNTVNPGAGVCCTTTQSRIPHTLFGSISQKIKLPYLIIHHTRRIWHQLTFFYFQKSNGDEGNIFSGCERDSGNCNQPPQGDSYQRVRAKLRTNIAVQGLYHPWQGICRSLV